MYSKRLLLILSVHGVLLISLALSMLFPIITAFLYDEKKCLKVFLKTSSLIFILGLVLVSLRGKQDWNLVPKDMYVITLTAWIIFCFFSTIPFFVLLNISLTNATFESMSAITTTGATILNNLNGTFKSILIWRSVLQWLGGVGFLIMVVAILPLLKIGGMKIFQNELVIFSEKPKAKSNKIAIYVIVIYIIFTFIGFLALSLTQMSYFEALNHAMTAISTAGFSTRDESFISFSNASQIITIILMILGSLPITSFLQINTIFQNQQIIFFLKLICIISIIFAVHLMIQKNYSLFESLKIAFFQTTSSITTTGFMITHYDEWENFAFILSFYLMFIGGCSGSTSGGIKIFRMQIALQFVKLSLVKMIHPRAVLEANFNNKPVDNNLIYSILTFGFLFSFTISFMAILLSLTGLNFITSISCSASIITNSGFGFGDILKDGHFENINIYGKWISIFGMIIGRLEIVFVFIFFTKLFWKN